MQNQIGWRELNEVKTNISETLKMVGAVIGTFLALDAFCFMAWVASGQFPVDNFYLGSITAHFIKLFI